MKSLEDAYYKEVETWNAKAEAIRATIGDILLDLKHEFDAYALKEFMKENYHVIVDAYAAALPT